MTIRLRFITILFSFFSLNAGSQSLLKGKIYDAETDSVIPRVNVLNLKTKQSVRSGPDGSYSILAEEGEMVLFTMTGFARDTVVVDFSSLLTDYNVTLRKQVISLGAVKVISSYKADSLARRLFYADVFKKQPGVTGHNTPSNGAGIVLSPFSFFSSKARQKRQLKKKLLKQEQEDYIDRSFPVEWVERLTSLHGDSLSLFMYRYRPSYSFCRKTDRDDMILYISDKLKEFKKQDPAVKPG